jgi:hypothetical protein
MLWLSRLSEVFRKFQPQSKDFDGALAGYSSLHTGVDTGKSYWREK